MRLTMMIDANVDDGSCVPFTQGCMNPNYMSLMDKQILMMVLVLLL